MKLDAFVNHVAATKMREEWDGCRKTDHIVYPRTTVGNTLEFGVYIVVNRKSIIDKKTHLEITLEAVWVQLGQGD